MPWEDALISGAANLLGGGLSFLGGQSQNATIAANNAAQLQFAQQQLAFQREAAQNGIKWRVDDARQAGVSPLVALGAPTFNPAPVAFGLDSPRNSLADTGAAVGRMGQDISRAVGATMTPYEKAQVALQTSAAARASAVSDADIRLKDAQANYYNSRAQGTPPMPMAVSDTGQIVPGQAQGHLATGVQGGNVNKLPEVATHANASAGVTSGRGNPGTDVYVNPNGSIYFQASKGSPASQGDLFESGVSFLQNRLGPSVGLTHPPAAIMEAIRRIYPDATGYKHIGNGNYRPVYPDEEVRGDLRLDRMRR